MNLAAIKAMSSNPQLVNGLYLSLGVGIGFASGAWFMERRLSARYDAILKEEIEKTKVFYGALTKKEYETPLEYEEILNRPGLIEAEEIVVEEKYKFPRTGTDYATKMAKEISGHAEDAIAVKRADEPYVISEDDFLENMPEHKQVRWTFYDEDNVYVSENNEAIPVPWEVIGMHDLATRWDELSDDGMHVYFRNERESLDVMMTITYESWAKTILGDDEEKEFEHQYKRERRKPRKFRSDDV